jgi:hypothetical protein
LFFRPYGYGQAGEIVAVVERPPASEIGIEDDECVGLVPVIGRIGYRFVILMEQLLARDHSQVLVQHIDPEVQVLHRGDRGIHDLEFVRGIEHAGLNRAQSDLAATRHQNLALRVHLKLSAPLHQTALEHQAREEHRDRVQPGSS